MAGKSSHGQDGYPIPHTNFKGAIDSDYINADLTPVDILRECTNLTPFRKAGSLQQAPGHASHLAASALPHGTTGNPYSLTGYKLIDFYIFQVDRDSKEITVVVYQNVAGTRTRIFINPWYNPSSIYSNYDSNALESTWMTSDLAGVYNWLELTEYYTGTITAASSFTLTLANTKPTGYFKGWFLVNATMNGSTKDKWNKKYNMVLSSTLSSGTQTLTMLADTSGYNAGDTYYLVRFPVTYLYNLAVNNREPLSANLFDPTITSFESFGNELRMGCGKDRRPLILQMIKERNYFEEEVLIKRISSLTLTNRGSLYYESPTTSDLYKALAHTVTITPTSGGSGASAHTTMGMSYAVKGSNTLVDGKTYVECDSQLTPYRIRPFTASYSLNLLNAPFGEFTVVDPGEYTIIIPKSTVSPAAPVDIQVMEVGGGDSAPATTLVVERMQVQSLILDNGGSGYNGVPTVVLVKSSVTGVGETTPPGPATAIAVTDIIVNNPMNYDGFWFDFEQPIQNLRGSQISAFSKSATADGSDTWYFKTNGSTNEWVTSEPSPGSTYGWLKFKLARQAGIRVDIKIVWGTNYPAADWKIGQTGNLEITLNTDKTIAEIMQQMVNIKCGDGYVTINPGGNVGLTYAMGFHPVIFARADGSKGPEADGNYITRNQFLAIDVEAPQLSDPNGEGAVSWTDLRKFAFILTAQIDRNEVIIAHGFWRPGDDNAASSMDLLKGLKINFGSWFSRRLLGINLYNKETQDLGEEGILTFESKLSSEKTYPFFKYYDNIMFSGITPKSVVDINEIPHFSSYSSSNFKKQIGSVYLAPFNQPFNNIDDNTYHLDKNTGAWYIWMYDNYESPKVGVTEDGIGLKWIIRANRYLDQDITMNYTKSAFVGQTNGRRFLVECKNSVEKETLENDDMIFPNNYGIGVSQYDTFLRDANIVANIGDTDIIRDIRNYRGYLVIVKDTNIYALDVNTEDELKYRVVDTMVGRGTKFGDSTCVTPYGIIVPSYDGVWLMSAEGVTPLMDSTNSKLAYYKATFAATPIINSVFYNDYNEVMIFMDRSSSDTRGAGTDVFVYNFKFKFWTYYSYGTTFVKKVRTDSNRNVVMLNGYYASSPATYNYNLVKLSETASTFISHTGLTYNIVWLWGMHNLPYGTRLKNILSAWLTLEQGYQTTGGATLTLTVYRDNGAGVNHSITINAAANYLENVAKDVMSILAAYSDNAGVTSFRFTLSNTTGSFQKYNLNSFYLWITTQNRVPQL